MISQGDVPAPFGPPGGALHGLADIFLFCRIFHAFIKGHDDVGPQDFLDLHGPLGAQENGGLPFLEGEGDALFFNFFVRKGKDLKSARIGEDGTAPSHELVKSPAATHGGQAFGGGHMIGVGKGDLGPGGFDIPGHGGAEKPFGAHHHEGRGLHGAVAGDKFSPPGSGSGILRDQIECDVLAHVSSN